MCVDGESFLLKKANHTNSWKRNSTSGYINWQTFFLTSIRRILSQRDLIRYYWNLFFQLAQEVAFVKLSGLSYKRKMFLSTGIVSVDGSSGPWRSRPKQANRRNILSFMENESDKANDCCYTSHLLYKWHIFHQWGRLYSHYVLFREWQYSSGCYGPCKLQLIPRSNLRPCLNVDVLEGARRSFLLRAEG